MGLLYNDCTNERTGRPLGGENFVKKLEKILERILIPQKPGPKVKEKSQKMGPRKVN